jgi:hypothetical protein
VVGQVVEPKELIFEVIDPDSLHIEATPTIRYRSIRWRRRRWRSASAAVPLSTSARRAAARAGACR